MIFKIFVLRILPILNRLTFGLNKKEILFVKINHKIENDYFDPLTRIICELKVNTRLKCMDLCAKNNACNFAHLENNKCNIYESLSYQVDILDGTFWLNKNKQITTEKNSNWSIKYTISQLIGSGYTLVYDQFYSNSTTTEKLNIIRNQCNSHSILCAGGGLVNSDQLLLMSCANCHLVLTQTDLNRPVNVGLAYWYMTSSKSFGFSPNSTIYQNSADTFDKSNPYRLSWHIDNGGGWRLGNLTGLNSDTNYKKYILIK